MAIVAGLSELGGGLLLAGGFLTPLASLLLATVMLNAIATVVWPKGFLGGYEFELTLLTVAVALAATGPGEFSLDDAIGWADEHQRHPLGVARPRRRDRRLGDHDDARPRHRRPRRDPRLARRQATILEPPLTKRASACERSPRPERRTFRGLRAMRICPEWTYLAQLIGVRRFELRTSPTRTERATRLRHTPSAERVAIIARWLTGTTSSTTRTSCSRCTASPSTGGRGSRCSARTRSPRSPAASRPRSSCSSARPPRARSC